MEIERKDIVFEIARRTTVNLDVIKALADGQDELKPDVFEATQLFNSLLGLIVLPEEDWLPQQTDDRLEILYAKGWPRPVFDNNDANCKRFKHLISLLRNSIAHGNIDFNPTPYRTGVRISHAQFWNHPDGNKANPINFKVTFTIDDLECLARKLAERILASRDRPSPEEIIEQKRRKAVA